jgi:uracil-DNA glycosylase family 4
MTIAGDVEINQTFTIPPPIDPITHARARVQARTQIKECVRCPLSKEQWVRAPVPWRGACPADVVIVGEAPGAMENRAGEPFVGPAGSLLDRMLADAGWDLSRIMYCNVVSCYPGQTPRDWAIDACRVHLLRQIALANTPFVILAGRVALESFRPDTIISNMGGSVFVQAGRLFYTMMHPAYVLRERDEREEVTEGLAAFRQVMLGLPWTNLLSDRCALCWSWTKHHDPEGVAYCQQHWEKREKTWTEREMSRKAAVQKKAAKARLRLMVKRQGEM